MLVGTNSVVSAESVANITSVLDTIVFNKHPNVVANALYFHDDSITPKTSWFGKKKIVHIGRMVFY